MDQNQKLKNLVNQRYSGDSSGFEELLNKTTKLKVEEKQTKLKITEDKKIIQAEKEYKEALAYVKDMISPAYMKIMPDKVKINNTFAKTFFVYAYPNFLEGNWLSPIINWDTKFDMSMFI
ncbi:MAG: hypothetical protein NWP80_00575, partial [Candidatus Gracilibacteria bacterium]|nr:hypothetical protein [Candidatus Gracilibacteria bacterium]